MYISVLCTRMRLVCSPVLSPITLRISPSKGQQYHFATSLSPINKGSHKFSKVNYVICILTLINCLKSQEFRSSSHTHTNLKRYLSSESLTSLIYLYI